MSKKFSLIDIQNIITQYNQGVSPKELAEKYGVYNNSITRLLRKNGIERNQHSRISEQDINFIIEEYNKGTSSEIIGQKIGRDGSAICRVLKRNGIQIRPATQNKRQYKIREDFFENIDNEEKAYFLGLLYADGNLSKRGNTIKLTLKDRDILEVWSKTIYGFHKIYEEPHTDENGAVKIYWSVAIYSQKMHQDLCKLGCTPKKTFSINFPEFMKDNLLCNHFIRGYFDGDGCISINAKNRAIIDITSNIVFIRDCIQLLNRNLGIASYYHEYKDKPLTACLQISAQENVKKFVDYIYKNSTVYLPRKYQKTQEFYQLLENKTIKKQLSKNNNNYGSFFIPNYNNIKLIPENLKQMSSEDKEQAIKYVFDFYRSNGFPYPLLDTDELIKEFSVLRSFDPLSINNNNKLSISNYTGTSIIKHFSPHIFEVKSAYSSKPSVLEAFNNDKMLLKTIKNRIDGNYTIHGNMIKQGLRNSRVAFASSIFNSTVAKFLYSKYTTENSIIYDYSMGFGQRLLGALALPYKITYVGVDPLMRSVNSNQQIFDFFSTYIPGLNKEVELIQSGSETYKDVKYAEKIDFAFSSPPYFDLEIYEKSPKQAYYNGYGEFINNYWKNTVANLQYLICKKGILALNIKEKLNKFNLAMDMCNTVKEFGFVQIDRYDLQLTHNNMFNNQSNKLEPIFVFQKQ